MNESSHAVAGGPVRRGVDADAVPVDPAFLATVRARMAVTGADLSDEERVDLLRSAEELKNAAAGMQAVLAADLDGSQRRQQAEAGLHPERLGLGIGAQVALARQESHHRGTRHLGLGKILTTELPHTLAAMRSGTLSEWRATLIARETACLSRAHRQVVDAELAGDPTVLPGCGDREVAERARRLAYRLDPHAALRRARMAEQDRRVSTRPAPDTMTWVSALLPVRDGVAVWAALTHAADVARNVGGDPRSHGHVMADLFTARITGRPASTGYPTDVPTADDDADPGTDVDAGSVVGAGRAARRVPAGLMVNLVMTDHTLLRGADDPAYLSGHGAVPPGWARGLVADALDHASADDGTVVFLRRLYTTPTGDALVAMDSRSRSAPAGLSQVVRLRDQTCRRPWCDAPIRHDDHVTAHAAGGSTSLQNLQGLCAACNYAKEAPGWTARAGPDTGQPHTVTLTTPTGHVHVSRAPAPVGTPPVRRERDGPASTRAA